MARSKLEQAIYECPVEWRYSTGISVEGDMAMANSENATNTKGTVLLVGGTGYVGDVMRYRMRDAGYTVRLLTRSSDSHAGHTSEGFQPVLGDVTNADSIVRALDGVDAVVNLVAVIKEKGAVTFE